MGVKKIGVLFLLISASLLVTSSAGRQRRYVSNSEKQVGSNQEEILSGEQEAKYEEDGSEIHERLLRANTKDYGRYDPAPALVKPPFKLIPN